MNTIAVNKRKDARIPVSSPARGLVFIADISGFTEMVRSTDLITGQAITRELLSTMVDQKCSGMQIAEIEGDAVFFYELNPVLSVPALYDQFERMKNAFDARVAELRHRYQLGLDLNLKAIAHYGEMAEFPIAGFRKLYGEVVIEAHRLLKNSIPGKSYLLITNELIAAAEWNRDGEDGRSSRYAKLCEMYSGLRTLCFNYIVFESLQLSA